MGAEKEGVPNFPEEVEGLDIADGVFHLLMILYFIGHMEYPLLSFTICMNLIPMDISWFHCLMRWYIQGFRTL